ncbi:hypothetical protein C1645_814522 [Glomus cerebriforme]|uniref:Uncharacterized protein n=1 Tax=Glomus cerebriforme TaxID=658196 RepID=A0A397TFW8_9GLOM|nr:hypothetical protein C1645_814522 [Glomus cerebriforme]
MTPANPVNMFQSLHDCNMRVMQPITQIQDYSTHNMTFFYNPPNVFQIYHITCNEMPVSFELVSQLLNNIDDGNTTQYYIQSKNYVFYHEQLSTRKIYRVTCELASPQFLNKKFYNIEYNQNDQQQEFSSRHQSNLKFHLKQFLIDYLAPKEIYRQNYNLHGNMMQDNFNDQIMNHQSSFQLASDIQGYDNNLDVFQSQQ